MRYLRVRLGACAILAAGPAAAADLDVYASPAATPGPAYSSPGMVAGDAGLALGYFSFDGASNGEIWGAGRVNIPVHVGWSEEIELSGLTGFETDTYYTYGIYSHTYWKDEHSAVGLLLAGSNLAGGTAGTVGVEGAIFLPTTTWVGLLGYSWGGNGQPNFLSAGGEGRWYWEPNSKLTGTVSYNQFNAAWKLTAGAEHRFAGTVVSLFGEGTYYTQNLGTGWEVFAGGRIFFDQTGQTLQGHDHEVPFAAARAITF
jgi:hypothetical protein